MDAPQELEQSASKYAAKAVRLDQQGSRGMAITMYQRTIETLLRLSQLYPDYNLNQVYVKRARAYQERIEALQGKSTSVQPQKQTKDQPTQPTKRQLGGKKSGQEEQASYNDLIMKEKPEVTWDEVVGLEAAKKAIKEAIVYPVQRPDLFPLGWPRGILLFGPPGCGKTLLAAAVATEIDATFLSIDAASIMSKWLGEAEKNVARLLGTAKKSAREGKPSIVFIDELDSLMGKHSNEVGGEIRVRNQFLKEMDGLIDKGKNLHAYIIGATNKPWELDWPFIRRYQKRILIPLPSHHDRLMMFELYTGNLRLAENIDIHELARLSEGFSGSDIKDVCQAAHLKVVGEFFESGKADDKRAKPRPLGMEDFRQILENRKPSVSLDMIALYKKWFDAFKAL